MKHLHRFSIVFIILAVLLATAQVVRAATTLTTVDSPGNVGLYTSLVLNGSGNPVISYYDNTNGDLKLAVCGDPTCTTPTLTTVDSSGGLDTSLVLSGSGNPVISYYDGAYDLKLAVCGDPTCTTRTITTLDSAGQVGWFPSLVLNGSGNPVISYFHNTNRDLKLAVVEPEINVRGSGVSIIDGDPTPSTIDATDFGEADTLSGVVDHTFTIENTDIIALNLTVSVGGANAADFTVIALPGNPVAAGGSTTFTVRFDPSAAGPRTAALSIANNDGDENPYDFAIQGRGCLSTVIVTSSADSGPGSLRQAINDVCTGGMITFDGDPTIRLASQLTIDRNMTIDGAGHTVTVSGDTDGDGTGDVRVFHVSPGVAFNLNQLTVTNGNAVTGGGIYNEGGTVNVMKITFSGNHATEGGGIANSGGALTVSNSTFAANGATRGGGIHNTGTLNVTNSTFSANSASDNGGGIYNSGGSATFRNSLVAGSLSGGNCSGAIGGSNNLADDNSCGAGFTQSSSILLGALGSYGGSTQTLPLLPGSAAIDTGNDAICAAAVGAPNYGAGNADQRGVSRTGNGAHCDIGAYERQSGVLGSPPVVTAASIPGLGVLLEGQQFTSGFSQLMVTFDQDVLHDGSIVAADTPPTTCSSAPAATACRRLAAGQA